MRHAGASPKTIPVSSESARVKPSTRQSSRGSSELMPRPPQWLTAISPSLIQIAKMIPKQTAEDREQHAFSQQLTDESPATRAERQSQPDLFLSSGCARQQEVRDVRARDQQHEANDAEQQVERRRVISPPVHLALPARICNESRILFRIEIADRVAAACLRCGLARGAMFQRPIAETRFPIAPAPVRRVTPGFKRPMMRNHQTPAPFMYERFLSA